jgi:mRNA interferase RelE/StbE
VTGGSRAPLEIYWAAPARRALRRLPEKVATAAIEFIYGPLAGNPGRAGRPLRFELEGMHSAHRGDYRVVSRIDERRRRVEVLAIGHRADVYRRG